MKFYTDRNLYPGIFSSTSILHRYSHPGLGQTVHRNISCTSLCGPYTRLPGGTLLRRSPRSPAGRRSVPPSVDGCGTRL